MLRLSFFTLFFLFSYIIMAIPSQSEQQDLKALFGRGRNQGLTLEKDQKFLLSMIKSVVEEINKNPTLFYNFKNPPLLHWYRGAIFWKENNKTNNEIYHVVSHMDFEKGEALFYTVEFTHPIKTSYIGGNLYAAVENYSNILQVVEYLEGEVKPLKPVKSPLRRFVNWTLGGIGSMGTVLSVVSAFAIGSSILSSPIAFALLGGSIALVVASGATYVTYGIIQKYRKDTKRKQELPIHCRRSLTRFMTQFAGPYLNVAFENNGSLICKSKLGEGEICPKGSTCNRRIESLGSSLFQGFNFDIFALASLHASGIDFKEEFVDTVIRNKDHLYTSHYEFNRTHLRSFARYHEKNIFRYLAEDSLQDNKSLSYKKCFEAFANVVKKGERCHKAVYDRFFFSHK